MWRPFNLRLNLKSGNKLYFGFLFYSHHIFSSRLVSSWLTHAQKYPWKQLYLHFSKCLWSTASSLIDSLFKSTRCLCVPVLLFDLLILSMWDHQLLVHWPIWLRAKASVLLFVATKMKGTLSSVSLGLKTLSLSLPFLPLLVVFKSTLLRSFWEMLCNVWPNPFGLLSPGQDVHPSVWGLHAKTAVIRWVSPASTPTESACPQPLLISACLHSVAQYGLSYNSA